MRWLEVDHPHLKRKVRRGNTGSTTEIPVQKKSVATIVSYTAFVRRFIKLCEGAIIIMTEVICKNCKGSVMKKVFVIDDQAGNRRRDYICENCAYEIAIIENPNNGQLIDVL